MLYDPFRKPANIYIIVHEYIDPCLVAKSCPTLCDPEECSLPASSVHGTLQARIRVWAPFLSPRDLPNPGVEPVSPALQADSLPPSHTGALVCVCVCVCVRVQTKTRIFFRQVRQRKTNSVYPHSNAKRYGKQKKRDRQIQSAGWWLPGRRRSEDKGNSNGRGWSRATPSRG